MEVRELKPGQLFRLMNCGAGNNYLYTFVRNEFVDNKLEHSIIECIAGYWPAKSRGANQPEQFLLYKNPRQEKCNPFADCRVIELPTVDGIPLYLD